MNRKDVIVSLQDLISMDILEERNNGWLRRRMARIRDVGMPMPRDMPKAVRSERVAINGEYLSFIPDAQNKVGLYVAANPLSPEKYYFEVEVLDTGMFGAIGVGLVPIKYPMDSQPGWRAFSVGYHADDGHFKALERENVVRLVCPLYESNDLYRK